MSKGLTASAAAAPRDGLRRACRRLTLVGGVAGSVGGWQSDKLAEDNWPP